MCLSMGMDIALSAQSVGRLDRSTGHPRMTGTLIGANCGSHVCEHALSFQSWPHSLPRAMWAMGPVEPPQQEPCRRAECSSGVRVALAGGGAGCQRGAAEG